MPKTTAFLCGLEAKKYFGFYFFVDTLSLKVKVVDFWYVDALRDDGERVKGDRGRTSTQYFVPFVKFMEGVEKCLRKNLSSA